MKTALVTTCWLGNQDYIDKTLKWLTYYSNPQLLSDLGVDDIILLDNGSPIADLKEIPRDNPRVFIQRFLPHYARESHYDYQYLWRAVDFFRQLFDEGYQKVIYMDNDFYILSGKMANDIKALVDTWHSPWCPRHRFADTGLQVVTDGVRYKSGYPYRGNNGKCMELVLPTVVENAWLGDRHSEWGTKVQNPAWDFSAQVTFDMKMEYKP